MHRGGQFLYNNYNTLGLKELFVYKKFCAIMLGIASCYGVTIMIPENVLEALESVRASAATNMLDRERVIAFVDVADEEVADWLRSNPVQYMEALHEMSARMNGGDHE